jgi:hypothetical protein
MTKRLADSFDDFLMVKVSCRADDDPAGLIVVFVEPLDLLPSEGLDKICGPQNGIPQGMISPADPIEKIMNQIVWSIFYHLDLLEDHHPFFFHVLRVKKRMQENIRQEVDAERHVLIKDLRIEAGVFSARESIQRSTHRVNLSCNVESCTSFGSFEEKVLDEVGDPVFIGMLVS